MKTLFILLIISYIVFAYIMMFLLLNEHRNDRKKYQVDDSSFIYFLLFIWAPVFILIIHGNSLCTYIKKLLKKSKKR